MFGEIGIILNQVIIDNHYIGVVSANEVIII